VHSTTELHISKCAVAVP